MKILLHGAQTKPAAEAIEEEGEGESDLDEAVRNTRLIATLA